MSIRAYQLVGKACFSCGLCLALGTHRYAVHEELPQGWDHTGATFLFCRSCGTVHAVEHAGEAGATDRLRTRSGPVFVPLSPPIRRAYREVVSAEKRRADFRRKRDAKSQRIPWPQAINLLPAPPWKQALRRAVAQRGEALAEAWNRTLSNEGFVRVSAWVFAPLWMPFFLYEVAQDALWYRNHPGEAWNERHPIWVDAPETFRQREAQLLELHRDFERQWPVVRADVQGLPYDELGCAHCGKTGVLVEAIHACEPSPCPVCEQAAVANDDNGKIDASLFLMGDILFDREAWRLDWLERFDVDARSKPIGQGRVRLANGSLKPLRLFFDMPEGAAPLFVPPGHTWEIDLRAVHETSHAGTNLEVFAVMEGERRVYEAP